MPAMSATTQFHIHDFECYCAHSKYLDTSFSQIESRLSYRHDKQHNSLVYQLNDSEICRRPILVIPPVFGHYWNNSILRHCIFMFVYAISIKMESCIWVSSCYISCTNAQLSFYISLLVSKVSCVYSSRGQSPQIIAILLQIKICVNNIQINCTSGVVCTVVKLGQR